MLTKLEHAIAHLGTMNSIELESIYSVLQGKLNRLPRTTKCYFPDLPAELRNEIYYYAAIIHLREYGNTQRCGLLGVNKQIRIEFMDVMYSDQVATLTSGVVYRGEGEFKLYLTQQKADKNSLKTLLDGFEGIETIVGYEFREGDMAVRKMESLNSVGLISGRETSSVVGNLKLNTGDPHRCALVCCYIHEAKEYGLDYEIPADYPAYLFSQSADAVDDDDDEDDFV